MKQELFLLPKPNLKKPEPKRIENEEGGFFE